MYKNPYEWLESLISICHLFFWISNIRTIWWHLKSQLLIFRILRVRGFFISIISHHGEESVPQSTLHIYLRHKFLLYFHGATWILSIAKLIHVTCTASITTRINYAIILTKSAISSAFILNFMIWDGKIPTGNGVKKNKLA